MQKQGGNAFWKPLLPTHSKFWAPSWAIQLLKKLGIVSSHIRRAVITQSISILGNILSTCVKITTISYEDGRNEYVKEKSNIVYKAFTGPYQQVDINDMLTWQIQIQCKNTVKAHLTAVKSLFEWIVLSWKDTFPSKLN